MKFQHVIRIIDHSTLAVTIEDRTGTSIPLPSIGIQPHWTAVSRRAWTSSSTFRQTAITGLYLSDNRQENALKLPFWGQEDDYIRVGFRSVLG